MSDAHHHLPTEIEPLTEDEQWLRAADWSDYRKAFGSDPDPDKLGRDFRLFCAGWDAGRRSQPSTEPSDPSTKENDHA